MQTYFLLIYCQPSCKRLDVLNQPSVLFNLNYILPDPSRNWLSISKHLYRLARSLRPNYMGVNCGSVFINGVFSRCSGAAVECEIVAAGAHVNVMDHRPPRTGRPNYRAN